MNIASIDDTLLPVVLFIIYVIFVSVVRYDLKDKSETGANLDEQKLEEYPKAFTYQEAFSAKYDPDPVSDLAEEIIASVELESVEKVEAPISPEMTDDESIDTSLATPANYQSIPEILDSLGKRDIRKLCAPLGIKQKTNGTELTTQMMKALVKRKFKENPLLVVEVMSDRLPDWLSTLSQGEQQQQVVIEAC